MKSAAGTRSNTRVTDKHISAFEQNLRDREKKHDTVRKYVSCLRRFMNWTDGREITPELLTEYREYLQEGHQPATVIGNLTAINAYLDFVGLREWKLKRQKEQEDMSCSEEG